MIPVWTLLWNETFESNPVQRIPEPEAMTNPQQVQDYFDATNWTGSNNASFYMHISKMAPYIKSGQRVVELACGPAVILQDLASIFPDTEFIGCDLSKTMLEVATLNTKKRGLKNLSFRHENICELSSFNKESVDFAFSTLALHHLPNETLLEQCFHQIHRVLKHGSGKFYLHDFSLLRSKKSQSALVDTVKGRVSPLVYDDYLMSLRAAFPFETFQEIFQKSILRSHCQETTWGARVLMTFHNLFESDKSAAPQMPSTAIEFLDEKWRSFGSAEKLEYFLASRFVVRKYGIPNKK